MKWKTLGLLLSLTLGISSAKADDTPIEVVGATDCTTAFNAVHSSTDFSIAGDGGRHIRFVNHNKGEGNNWCNWLFGINSKADGTGEFLYLRADNYGWDANLYSYCCDYDFTNFMAEMNGATVDMYIYRKGTNVFIENTITTSGSLTWHSNACACNIDATTIYPFVSVELAYLEVTLNETVALPASGYDYPVVGLSNNIGSSEVQSRRVITGDGSHHFKFINYNSGTGANWDNYKVLCRDKESDALLFNLRADNWDDQAGANTNCTSNFNWSTFVADHNGATIDMDVTRTGTRVDVVIAITTTSSTVYNYSYYKEGVSSTSISLSLAANWSHLEVLEDCPNIPANMSITDAKYATFCAPFATTAPAGVTVYTVSAADNTSVTLASASNDIPAYTPVVLYSDAAVSQTFYGRDSEGTESSTYLKGVYEAGSIAAGNYVLQNNGDKVAFYVLGSAITGTANRCYLSLPSSAKALNVIFEGEETAIGSIASEKKESIEAIHTVGGNKTNALQRGINIVKYADGTTRKVLVK